MSEDSENVVNISEAPKKGRGRPKGSPNKPKAPEPAAENDRAVIGDNKPKAPDKVKPKNPEVPKGPLTDAQEHALTAHHALAYEKALKAKKDAASAFLNCTKLAKSEGVSTKQIKEYIEFQTEAGQERLREEIARQHKVARWAGAPVGTQLSFFEEVDRTPIDERVREDGKRAGLKAEPNTPPRTLPGNLQSVWQEGYNESQTILASRFKQKPEDDDSKSAIDDTLPEAAAE